MVRTGKSRRSHDRSKNNATKKHATHPQQQQQRIVFLVLFALALIVITAFLNDGNIIMLGGTTSETNAKDRLFESNTTKDQDENVGVIVPATRAEDSNNSTASTTITTTTTLPCWQQRSCAFNNNSRIDLRILYLAEGGAGLQDRGAIVKWLTRVAGYLCAINGDAGFYMRPPWFHLGALHNSGGGTLAPALRWSDFWDLRFARNGRPAVHDLRIVNHHPEDADVKDNQKKDELEGEDWMVPGNPFVWSYLNESHVEFVARQAFGLIFSSSHDAGDNNDNDGETVRTTILLSRNGSDVVRHFDQLRRMGTTTIATKETGQEQQRQTVVWAIKPNFYNWWKQHFLPAMEQIADQEMSGSEEASQLPHRCDYTNAVDNHIPPSPLIENLAAQVWQNLDADYPRVSAFGHLHLRRGDAVDQCNTTLARMDEYFQCSLKGTLAKYGQLALLFSSDESDAKYRRAVCDLVRSHGHLCIDLDRAVRVEAERVLNPQTMMNNYIVFQIVSQMVKPAHGRIRFRLVRRRHVSCWDCPNVFEMIERSARSQQSSA
eukprot:scaffold561_cov162-Amphora_coffeaeformis.AAC.20